MHRYLLGSLRLVVFFSILAAFIARHPRTRSYWLASIFHFKANTNASALPRQCTLRQGLVLQFLDLFNPAGFESSAAPVCARISFNTSASRVRKAASVGLPPSVSTEASASRNAATLGFTIARIDGLQATKHADMHSVGSTQIGITNAAIMACARTRVSSHDRAYR